MDMLTPMGSETLDLPFRPPKPRRQGLTLVIDSGVPAGTLADIVESAGDFIDLVKFGWGTALVDKALGRKIAGLREADIGFFFGGTLFEKFVYQDRFDDFRRLCQSHNCAWVEVSNGTIPLSNVTKAEYVSRLCTDFAVLSEVGYKAPQRSAELAPKDWVECMSQDLEAGAALVVAEARESGRAGICEADGQLRCDLIERILDSGLDRDQIVFEAPNKDLQARLVRRLGPNANLGNIAPADVIGLETLRLGLRSDTLLVIEGDERARYA
jgi:phosphosulfolactate synthase